ncbi:MAG TPA: metallophosphoesterase [Candidatus Faecimonas gallistercoris]|nr:metallophosphoesterase [Candidatus Faecimonas gallistercoris]
MVTRTERNEEKQNEIIKEENRELRKKIVLTTFKIILIIIIISMTFFLYTTYISSKIISVKETRITSEKLPKSFDGLKIIQISDIHYGSTIFIEDIKNLINIINRRNPDLVVFTGDLINKNYKINSSEQEKLIKQMKKIKSTIGKYAILGEEDSNTFTTIMNQSNFTILNNSYELIYKNSNTPILLIGLNSSITGAINIDQAYKYFTKSTHNNDIFTISLLHEPDSVDNIISSYPTDIFLAGHSHNGQIALPYIGGIIKKEGAKNYINEFYQLNNSKLYISSGLGTNGNGIRLFCHPSINFFRLSSK